jgi:sterol desaturase/sphingolipid hydroxylase (fatty acid hydroxylase superfamily)
MGEVLSTLASAILGPLVFVAGIGVFLVPLERIFSAAPRAPVFARRRLVDLAHWSVGAALGKALAFVATIAALVAWAPAIMVSRVGARVTIFSFERLPFVLQVIAALVVADFFSYWVHRLFHQAPLWRFHAVHHSSTRLDWLSAARNHPVGEALGRVLGVLPVLLMGIDPRVLAVVGPVIGLWAILLHANVPWGFGALRYVIATPIFHRWHHSREVAARDKNFAGLFPIWDLMFGTYFVPVASGKLVQPIDFGIDEAMPEGFVGQLVAPFRVRALSGTSRSRDR